MKKFIPEQENYSAPSVERLTLLTEKGFALSDGSGLGTDIDNGAWGPDENTHE